MDTLPEAYRIVYLNAVVAWHSAICDENQGLADTLNNFICSFKECYPEYTAMIVASL